jgi:hypothetical protein
VLTKNQVKEELSIAYMHAIAAQLGFSCECPRRDMDSVDIEIKAHGKLSIDSTIYSPEIKFQLKATSGIDIRGDQIHFALPVKNYNDLRANSMTPRLLVVFELPEDETTWLIHSPQGMSLKKCAYWLNLAGAKETHNKDKKTIHIPLAQVLSPHKLYELMLLASQEEL